jgi:hypothetical protein
LRPLAWRYCPREDAANAAPAITNKRLFTLSILTACLLPPTLVSYRGLRRMCTF